MASGRPQPSNSTIVGVAVLLFGAVLLGVGMHHLVSTGSCSSTGYSANLGPVPRCPKGTGWWILFLIGGIFMIVIGGLVTQGSSAMLIIPAVFGAIGIGSLTVAFQGHGSSGTKTFALIFGGAFAAAGLIPALAIAWSGIGRLRSSARAPTRAPTPFNASTKSAESPFGAAASQPDAIMGAYAAGAPGGVSAPAPVVPSFTPSLQATGRKAGADPLDKIAKLAELRQRGALTEDEFNREKAKLLGEL